MTEAVTRDGIILLKADHVSVGRCRQTECFTFREPTERRHYWISALYSPSVSRTVCPCSVPLELVCYFSSYFSPVLLNKHQSIFLNPLSASGYVIIVQRVSQDLLHVKHGSKVLTADHSGRAV
jgi:hypothetical protein